MNDAVMIGVAGALFAVGNPWVVPRLQRWWRDRRRAFADCCEVCGSRPPRIWSLVATFDDDDALGIEGGSFAEATFCKAHRPPGARRRPNRRR